MARDRRHIAVSAALSALTLGACVADLDPAALVFACATPDDCAAGFVCAETPQGNACLRLVGGEVADTGGSEVGAPEVDDREVAGSEVDDREVAEPEVDAVADTHAPEVHDTGVGDVVLGEGISHGPCAGVTVSVMDLVGVSMIFPCGATRVPLPYASEVCAAFGAWRVAGAADLAAQDECPWSPDAAVCGAQCLGCPCERAAHELCAALPEAMPACGVYWSRSSASCTSRAYDFELGRGLVEGLDAMPASAYLACVPAP